MLGRDTLWRQGDVMTDEDARKLGLVNSPDSENRVVVISHDCDLPNEAEEFVEVIVGEIASSSDPKFVNARNPRRLHLLFSADADQSVCLDLRFSGRMLVEKRKFSKFRMGDPSFKLADNQKRALKQWLASRYGRPAFPNAFENRLRKSIGKRTVEKKIEKILEPESRNLVGLFFDLCEGRNEELATGNPYLLSISVVYDAIEGGSTARKAAEKVAKDLIDLFHSVYGTPETSNEIALEKCQAVADTSITLADLRKVDQWRLEYISLNEAPAGDFVPAGRIG
ncbi:MAG: hypothetical protein ACYDBP_01445 [Leptospirales bacterium]